VAKFHVATNTPPKPVLIADWVREQPWAPSATAAVEVVGSIHLEDPDGEVGMQIYVVESDGAMFQVPVTYRDAPLPAAPAALIGTVEHSVLGLRYVHDGVYDDQLVTVLAGVASAGYGQSLGFAQHEGRWYAWPDELRLHGSGVLPEPLPVDRFTLEGDDGGRVVLQNDHLKLTLHRSLTEATLPPVGLATTLPGTAGQVTLVEVGLLPADRR